MLLSRIFHEIDAKGREHVNKQYLQEYEEKCFSGYISILTTIEKEKAKILTIEEAEYLIKRLSYLKQKFMIES